MAGTLYTYPDNFRAYKALIAAQYSGTKVNVAADFVFGETNKNVTFLKKFPAGKVPAFETADGKYLTESNAIAFYLSNSQLRGNTDLEKAQVWQWISFADSEILPASCVWVFPLLGIMPLNKNALERAKEDVKAALNVLNQRLVENTYLVGERITLADISVFSTLIHLYQYALEPEFRAAFPSVNRWFTTILNQTEVKAVVKDFTICSKALEFDPKKYAEFQGKTGGAKTAAAKPAAEKKEKKPAAKKEAEPVEEMDAIEIALAGEPKSKDPFEELPKSSFNFDDFKRCYSNEDESVSVPYFWEKFDAENCSIWYGEYKYNDELAKVFMSCNLITGMFQRLDKMRKQSFSSVCLFGEDNNSTISGIWVWKGQGLAFDLCKDWQIDYDCYDWKKLDAASSETKDLVKQYFSWTGTDKKGRKFNQGKVFK